MPDAEGGNVPVVGIKDCTGREVKALKVESTDAQTLHRIILENVAQGSMIYTDGHRSY